MKRMAIIVALALGSAGAYAQGSTDSSGDDMSTNDSQSDASQPSDAGAASNMSDEGSAAERLGGTGSSRSSAGDMNDSIHPEDRDDTTPQYWDREGE